MKREHKGNKEGVVTPYRFVQPGVRGVGRKGRPVPNIYYYGLRGSIGTANKIEERGKKKRDEPPLRRGGGPFLEFSLDQKSILIQ